MCFIAVQWDILIWSWGKPWSWASGQYPWVRTSVFAQAGLLRKSVWFMEAQEIALFWKACAASLLPDAQSHENNCLNAKCNLITRSKAPHLWSDWSPSCVCEWFPWLHSPGSEAPAALVRGKMSRVVPGSQCGGGRGGWSHLSLGMCGGRDHGCVWGENLTEEELAKSLQTWSGQGPRRS